MAAFLVPGTVVVGIQEVLVRFSHLAIIQKFMSPKLRIFWKTQVIVNARKNSSVAFHRTCFNGIKRDKLSITFVAFDSAAKIYIKGTKPKKKPRSKHGCT